MVETGRLVLAPLLIEGVYGDVHVGVKSVESVPVKKQYYLHLHLVKWVILEGTFKG